MQPVPVPRECSASEDSDVSDSLTDVGSSDAVDEKERCKYPSKYCGRARARKTNGTLHRFCEYHRLKANTNQKRWTRVRREQAAFDAVLRQQQFQQFLAHQQMLSQHQVAHVYAPMPLVFPYCQQQPAWRGDLLPAPTSLSDRTELSVDDAEILCALLMTEAGPQGHAGPPAFAALDQDDLYAYSV